MLTLYLKKKKQLFLEAQQTKKFNTCQSTQLRKPEICSNMLSTACVLEAEGHTSTHTKYSYQCSVDGRIFPQLFFLILRNMDYSRYSNIPKFYNILDFFEMKSPFYHFLIKFISWKVFKGSTNYLAFYYCWQLSTPRLNALFIL